MSSPLPVFRKLCALDQLELDRAYPRLLPLLLHHGLSGEDSLAVAYNCTLLHRTLEPSPASPAAVLRKYSLDEIAELCEIYHQVERGQLDYGERVEP